METSAGSILTNTKKSLITFHQFYMNLDGMIFKRLDGIKLVKRSTPMPCHVQALLR